MKNIIKEIGCIGLCCMYGLSIGFVAHKLEGLGIQSYALITFLIHLIGTYIAYKIIKLFLKRRAK